jgi:hypothetical protein
MPNRMLEAAAPAVRVSLSPRDAAQRTSLEGKRAEGATTMGSSGTDKVFSGSILKFYETYLVPPALRAVCHRPGEPASFEIS